MDGNILKLLPDIHAQNSPKRLYDVGHLVWDMSTQDHIKEIYYDPVNWLFSYRFSFKNRSHYFRESYTKNIIHRRSGSNIISSHIQKVFTCVRKEVKVKSLRWILDHRKRFILWFCILVVLVYSISLPLYSYLVILNFN